MSVIISIKQISRNTRLGNHGQAAPLHLAHWIVSVKFGTPDHLVFHNTKSLSLHSCWYLHAQFRGHSAVFSRFHSAFHRKMNHYLPWYCLSIHIASLLKHYKDSYSRTKIPPSRCCDYLQSTSIPLIKIEDSWWIDLDGRGRFITVVIPGQRVDQTILMHQLQHV